MTSNGYDKRRLTPKMEKFAQGIALGGMNQTDAYSKAYDTLKMSPKTINDASSKLAAHPAVAQRIVVLRERATAAAVKKAGYSLADAMDEAGLLLDDAKALGQISAGVAAAKLRAQLGGFLAEKKETRQGPLDDVEVAMLLAMRDEIVLKIKRLEEEAKLTGEVIDSGSIVASFRRVIN